MKAQFGLGLIVATAAVALFAALPVTSTRADDEAAKERVVLEVGDEEAQQVVSGRLILRDEEKRTFRIAGQENEFIAPEGVDLRALHGESVDVMIDGQGQVASIRKNDAADS